MDETLRRLLEQMNPWLGDRSQVRRAAKRRLPDELIARSHARMVGEELDGRPRLAHLIVGPRQAGKSTIVWSLLAEDPIDLLLLNCEESLVREWCRSPTLFLADLDAWLPEGGLLFLEEAQWLDEAGLFVKGVVDAHSGRTIVVTGSSSFHLMARTRESLAGRATRHYVWPLSLAEVSANLPRQPDAAFRAKSRELMERQIVIGGYPAAWTDAEPARVLDELLTAVVLRDASDRFRVARPDAFRHLLRLAAGQVGNLVRQSEWAQILGIGVSTVADYIGLLEETHILRLVRPYAGGRRAELTLAPKVYFIDNGLRNALAGRFAPLEERTDAGALLENWVFSELHKAFPEPDGVRFWRTRNGAEVDFVLEPALGQPIPIEVKGHADLSIPRSLRSFIEAYRPTDAIIVHRGEASEARLGDTVIRRLPAETLPQFLEALRSRQAS